MKSGTFFLRWLIAFIAINFLEFVGHGLLLKADYSALGQNYPGIVRTPPDSNAHWPWMILAFAVIALALVWIYGKGRARGPWLGQGIRFGIAVWLLSPVYSYLIYFAIQPWPPLLIAKQIAWDFLAFVLTGALIALLFRNDPITGNSA